MLLQKEPWKHHPWSDSGKTELLSVDFLLRFCNPNPTEETDLCDGTICHQEKVWKNILEEGMQEPLMLRINPNEKEIRLESGNHRVRLAKKYNISHLPVATFITNRTIFHKGNGPHIFELSEKFLHKHMIRCPYDYQIKLSEHMIDASPLNLLPTIKKTTTDS